MAVAPLTVALWMRLGVFFSGWLGFSLLCSSPAGGRWPGPSAADGPPGGLNLRLSELAWNAFRRLRLRSVLSWGWASHQF